MMVDQFIKVTEDMNFVEQVQNERHISPYEALIVASIAQAEAGTTKDFGKVARVPTTGLYARLPAATAWRWTATINYWLEMHGQADQGVRRT